MSLRSEIIAALDEVTALGGRNYADAAPEATEFPYTTVRMDVARAPALVGDSKVSWWSWVGQVDLWQRRADEDATILAALLDALDGMALTDGLHLRVRSVPRVADPDYEIIHHALTIATPIPR